MTESRQSKTPGGSCPSSSQIEGSQVLPAKRLLVLLPSLTVGCAGSIFHVFPFKTNLNWTSWPKGTLTSTDQTEPAFAIGLPTSHVSGPPKSPRSSTLA